jgi:undecaprenyl-diphosphatase
LLIFLGLPDGIGINFVHMNFALINPGLTAFQKMLQYDFRLMFWFNRSFSNPILDKAALLMRESLFHTPLYVFIILYVSLNLKKKAWWWILGAVLLIFFTDGLSSHFLKGYYNRPRPCSDPLMASHINFLAKYCGTNGSFPSSHAVNHFAFATYSYQTLKKSSSYFGLLFIWASLICLAQVYVGVHYPLDIFVGAILGCLFGFIAGRIVRQTLSLHYLSI